MTREVCGICWCPYDESGACGCQTLDDALRITRGMARAYENGYKAGVAHEREACAKVCDDMEHQAEGIDCCKWPTPGDCAFVIRARSKE